MSGKYYESLRIYDDAQSYLSISLTDDPSSPVASFFVADGNAGTGINMNREDLTHITNHLIRYLQRPEREVEETAHLQVVPDPEPDGPTEGVA